MTDGLARAPDSVSRHGHGAAWRVCVPRRGVPDPCVTPCRSIWGSASLTRNFRALRRIAPRSAAPLSITPQELRRRTTRASGGNCQEPGEQETTLTGRDDGRRAPRSRDLISGHAPRGSFPLLTSLPSIRPPSSPATPPPTSTMRFALALLAATLAVVNAAPVPQGNSNGVGASAFLPFAALTSRRQHPGRTLRSSRPCLTLRRTVMPLASSAAAPAAVTARSRTRAVRHVPL